MTDLISRAELFNRLAPAQTLGEAYAIIQDMPTSVPKFDTCYGYDIKDLINFAMACRNSGVNEEDLKEFSRNAEFAWKSVTTEVKTIIENEIDRLKKQGEIDGNDN